MNPTQFIKNQYRCSSFEEKVEPYLTNTEYKGEIKTFVLEKSMYDTEIQKTFKTTPIPVETAGSFIQKFLENADKSKWYICLLKTEDSVVAVDVYWDGDEWRLIAHGLDESGRWSAGYVFFTPATAETENLNSSETETLKPLETLSFDQALKIVKDAGCKVIRTKIIEEEL